MPAPKTILVGDRIRWASAAGMIRGEVIRIVQAKNAAGDMIDWIHVEYFNPKSPSKHSIAVLADTALEMLRFIVTFRDIDIQIARGEKNIAA